MYLRATSARRCVRSTDPKGVIMIATSFERSPQRYARLSGIIYLAIILLGLFGEVYVRNSLIVSGDPATTLENISRAPLLWRAGIVGDLLMQLCDIPVICIFYLLFRPVNKPLALLATLFNLIQTAVLAGNKLTLVVPLLLLDDSSYLAAFSVQQQQVLAYLAIKAHGYGFGIGLLFFGFACLVRGHLILDCGFLPKALGRLLQIAGLCYLINSFALLLAPAFADVMFPAILVPPLIGELSLCMWLMIKGIDVEQWLRKAAAKDAQIMVHGG